MIYGESGSGKSYSSLLLARGFAGAGKVGMIDTEAGRGEAYADMIDGGYDVLPMRETFSPEAYNQALKVAEAAELDALIIDSGSHEWSGPGGVLSMAAAEEEKAISAGRKKSILTWQKPKREHSHKFMLPLLQTPIPLVILCLRARYPMVEKKNAKGEKEWVRSDDLEPIQADDILFEAFVHGWVDRHHRFRVTKLTRPDLAQVFRDGELITIETGQRLAAWAKGTDSQSADQVTRSAEAAPPTSLETQPPGGAVLSFEELENRAREAAGQGEPAFKAFYKTLNKSQKGHVNSMGDELRGLMSEVAA
ncbi:MAG TPA: hypothetical protein VI756_03680 [Blastocatellia bacterium]